MGPLKKKLKKTSKSFFNHLANNIIISLKKRFIFFKILSNFKKKFFLDSIHPIYLDFSQCIEAGAIFLLSIDADFAP